MTQYKVIGPAPVCDVEPGGTVTQEQLDAAGAKVEFLIGIHLEEVKEEAPLPPAPPATAAPAAPAPAAARPEAKKL